MIAYPTPLGRDPILPATCAARGVLVEAGTAGGRPLSPSGNISILDLFCGAGGAAMGYRQAFPDAHITGVDINPQPHYPFEFVQADAMTFPLDGYDLIHASPPCQAYTTMNNRHGSASAPLIGETRERLIGASCRAWVLENVSGALAHMPTSVELTGEMFGLGVHRPRLFESNQLIVVPGRPRRQLDPIAVYGKQDGRRLWTRADGSELHVANLEQASVAMGIDWMTWDEIREAIPPAYTRYIGETISHVIVRGLPATRPVEAVPVSGSTSSLGPDTGQREAAL